MGRSYHSGNKTEDGDFKLLLAAGLLCRYERSSRQEIYGKALKCFEILIDVLEDPDTAQKISALVSRPITYVTSSSKAIIDLLLFNSETDPYVSLGLPRHSCKADVTRRWKRLIVLYHPDKYFDQKEYEEKAKKINEAYEKIQNMQGENSCHPDVASTKKNDLNRTRRAYDSRYMKKVPAFILALAIFILIISVWFFISI